MHPKHSCSSRSEYIPPTTSGSESQEDVEESADSQEAGGRGRRRRRRRGPSKGLSESGALNNSNDDNENDEGPSDLSGLSGDEAGEFDDADDDYFEQRLARSWLSKRRERMTSRIAIQGPSSSSRQINSEEERTGPAEREGGEEASVSFDGGFRVPERTYR